MSWDGQGAYRCEYPGCPWQRHVLPYGTDHANGTWAVAQHRLEHARQQLEIAEDSPIEPAKTSAAPLPSDTAVAGDVAAILAGHHREAMHYAKAARESDRLRQQYLEGSGV